MKPDKVIEELHLKTYEYVQNQNSFVHLEKSSEKNFTFYDFDVKNHFSPHNTNSHFISLFIFNIFIRIYNIYTVNII